MSLGLGCRYILDGLGGTSRVKSARPHVGAHPTVPLEKPPAHDLSCAYNYVEIEAHADTARPGFGPYSLDVATGPSKSRYRPANANTCLSTSI